MDDKKIKIIIYDKNEIIEDSKQKLYKDLSIVKSHSKLFDTCKKYTQKWCTNINRISKLSISNNYVGVNLNLYLSKDDSQIDIDLFIDDIEDELNLNYIKTQEYTNGKWVMYKFKNENNENLYIFFHYGMSEKCKLIETGEYTPVFKRVCI